MTDVNLGPLAAAVLAANSMATPLAGPPDEGVSMQASRRHEAEVVEEGAPAAQAPVQQAEQAPPSKISPSSGLLLMGAG